MNLRHLHWKYLGAYGSIKFMEGALRGILSIPEITIFVRTDINNILFALSELRSTLHRSYQVTKERELKRRQNELSARDH